MEKINVAVVHGIGNEKAGYSNNLSGGVLREFDMQLKSILKAEDDYSSEIQFKEILWEDIVSKNQKKLEEILAASETPLVRGKGLWQMCRYFFQAGIRNLRRTFTPEAICDIIGYRDPVVCSKIHQRVLGEINSIWQDSENSNLTLIGHSLGTVIAYDFVFEQQQKSNDLRLSNLFTLGSPLAIFVLQYEGTLFKEPVELEDPHGRWVNVYDKDDPIAYQLKPLDGAYNKAVLADCAVDTGPFGAAHLFYWGNRDVHKIIGRKLAIDWISLNKKLSSQEIEKLYKDYDGNLGLGKETN